MIALTPGKDQFAEMKAYVGFTPHDALALKEFWPIVEPRVGWICDRFYQRILDTPSARSVLKHESQVASLKVTLAQWLRELLNGPHDDDYAARRRRIGSRHVEVGLPVRFMFMAMSGFAQDLDALCEKLGPDAASRTRTAIRRVTDLDLALMTGTYVEGRESKQLATLQDLIVSHMPVGILLFDSRGRLTAATTAAGRFLRSRETLGLDWREALPQALIDAADLDGLVQEALAEQEPRVLPRVDADLGRGSSSLRITAVPLDSPRARVLLHIEDVSDAIDLEARMQQSQALAQLGALSAAVAHELRNPLAGMSAAIQVLVPSFPDNDRRKAILGKFDDQVRRLDELVNSLLSFARPGQVSMRSVDLRPICESVVELVTHDSPKARFEVVGDGRAYADSNRIHEILLNLVNNAQQAAQGDGHVRVILEDGLIAVEDDGPGVPDDVAERVFKPFFTTKTRGTGLGLAICARSANAMGGDLGLAEPRVLTGARFELRLQPDPA